MKNFVKKYADFVVKRRWLVILVSIITVFGAASGARFLAIEGDVNIYFSEDMPQVIALNEIHDDYEKTDNIVVVIEATKGTVFTPDILQAIEDISEDMWKAPYVSRVDAITNFQNTVVSGDDISIKDLCEDGKSKTSKEVEYIKRTALGETELVNRIISETGHVAGVFCTVNFPKEDFMVEGPKLVEYARGIADKYKNEDVNVRLTGTAMIDQAFAESGTHDMTTLMPVMYLMIIIMLFVCFRSISGTLATLAIVFMSTALAMGIFGYLGFKLNTSTAIAPTMIMTIVIADCIHFLTTTIQIMRRGVEKHEAIRESIRMNFQPIFLTSITTIIGYLSMNFSDSPPFRELGNLVAIGVMAGFSLSIFFLPAFIAAVRFTVRPKELKQSELFLTFSRFIIRNKKRVFTISVFTSLLVSCFTLKNEVNDMFIDFFDEEMEIIKDTKFTVDNLTGVYSIEYSLKTGEENGITDPAYLQKVEEFENWFKKQDKVIHVSAFTNTVRRINKMMHGNDEKYAVLPTTKAASNQYLLLYEMSLPFGRDITNQINMDKSASRLRVTFENMYTSELRDIELRGNQWLRDNAPESMWFEGTSTSVMFRYLSERNIDFMMFGFGIALILISITLIFAFKSIKYGLLSLIPNILPSLVAFGLWGLLSGKIGMAVAFVTSITLGIVVDDTIHFISKYIVYRRDENLSVNLAMEKTFANVGQSLLNTSVVLVAGFSVLMFSSFEMNSSMGVLCAITIAMALILDYFLLPSLILLIDKDEQVELETQNVEK